MDGDDALGVARSAAPDEFVILARRDKGRNRVHVRGERHDRFAETSEDVQALRLNFHGFQMAIVSRAEPCKVVAQIQANRGFFRRHGWNVYQSSCQFENVHSQLSYLKRAHARESEGVMRKFTVPEALHPMISSDDSGGDSTHTPSRMLPISACDFGGRPLPDTRPMIAGTTHIRS